MPDYNFPSKAQPIQMTEIEGRALGRKRKDDSITKWDLLIVVATIVLMLFLTWSYFITPSVQMVPKSNVSVDGKMMSAATFCAQATKDHQATGTAMSADLTALCN